MPLNLEKQLRFYGAYHNDPVNIAIHITCVPAILLTAILLCTNTGPLYPLPEYVQVPYLLPNLGVIVSLVYAVLYILLEPVAGGLLSVLILVGTIYVNYLAAQYGMTANYWALGVHVASWIAQFIGHGKFEGRAPALLDNLFQAFFLAPLFVWLEILFAFGYRPELRYRVEMMVEQDIANFRSKKQQNVNGAVNDTAMNCPSLKYLKHLSAPDIVGLKASIGSGRILITDKDYTDEIAYLEASTRCYIAQTKVLTAQCESLQRFSQPSSSRVVNRAHLFSQTALHEAQCAKALNDDTINELRDRLQTASTSLEGLSKTLPSHVSERLKAHDRTISALESSLLDVPNYDGDANTSLSDDSRIELLATALAKHRADSLRDHLDRIFLDNLSKSTEDECSDFISLEELQALENDIQALYVEIDDVSSMLISREYLQPLKTSIDQDRTSQAAAKAEKYYTIVQKLNALASELSSWDEHAQTLRSGLVLHRHLDARLTQIETDVNTTAQPPAPAPALGGPSKLELATERCLSHIGGGTEATMAADTHGGEDEIPDLLGPAASARAVAVASLAAAAQISTPHSSTVKLDELDARVSEAQRLFLQSQPT
ncbi:hypothetical protein DV736_g2685, partial [Chaetothyriales sp. CBS 134916]